MSINPTTRVAKTLEIKEFSQEVSPSKAAQEIAKGVLEEATSFWSEFERINDTLSLKNLVSLKRDTFIRSDAKDFKSLFEFFNLSSSADLSQAEFDFLVEIVKRNSILRNNKDLLSILHIELFLSLKNLLGFMGVVLDEEIIKQNIFESLLSLMALMQHPEQASLVDWKLTFNNYKSVHFKSFSQDFESHVKEKKLAKLKTKEKKEQINHQKESLLNEHLKVFSLLEKLYLSKDALSMLKSPLRVFPECAFSTSEAQRDRDLQRVQSFYRIDKIWLMSCLQDESDSSRAKESLKLRIDIDRFIQKFLDHKDTSNKESLSKELVFILDWIEKEAKKPVPSDSRFESFSRDAVESIMAFELLYYLLHFPKVEPDFSYQLVAARAAGLCRFWDYSYNRWVNELLSRNASGDTIPVSLYENVRLKFVTPKLKQIFLNFAESTRCGAYSIVARSEFKELLNHLNDVLPVIFADIKRISQENLEEFDRKEFINSNLWLVSILLLKSDLEVSVHGSLIKGFEVSLLPLLTICEEAVILKAESQRISIGKILEQENESEVEDFEAQEMLESLSLEEKSEMKSLPSVATKVEKVRASNFGKSSLDQPQKGKEKQKKEMERISAQDLMNLRGKNIRLIFKLLEQAGFERKRSAKGSHEIWGPKEKEGNQAVIPKHDTVSPGVLKSIANQLGLEKKASN